MTTKERWLAALKLEPVDRLPFWPKLDAAYPRAQEPPFREMGNGALHAWIGADPHDWTGPCIKELRRHTSVQSISDHNLRITTFNAPGGSARLVLRFDEASQSAHPIEFPAKSLEDIKLLTAFHEDCSVELDPDALEEAREQAGRIGQSAIIGVGIGISPLMDWVQYLAGIENAHVLLADHRGEVEALFDVMHRLLVRKAEIICETTPADMVYMIENTSTTLISPQQFRRYCLRHIGEYARTAQRAGRPMVLHMCGKLKRLLSDLATLPVAAFEAFTSPTVGDTTLLDGRIGCADKCLIGGTNAALWIRPANTIIAQIERDLAPLPHHRGIVLTSAGVMPPLCQPETIRQVCDWVKSHPVRN